MVVGTSSRARIPGPQPGDPRCDGPGDVHFSQWPSAPVRVRSRSCDRGKRRRNGSSVPSDDVTDVLVPPTTTPLRPTALRSKRWITDWRPEDEVFWSTTGAPIAKRNLVFSILSE